MSVTNITSGQSFQTLTDAINASSAADVIQLSAGTYVENFPNITHSLTIQSVGGMAYLSNPQPDPPNGRAVLNVPGNLNVSLTIDHLDISGAVDDASNPPAVGGANGAGILFEAGNGALVVRNSHIHGNEDGILTGGSTGASTGGMTVTIDHSEVDHNGLPSSNPRYGYDHNLYIGAVTQFTVTNSYIHDALGGHEIKSRAFASVITGNRIQDNAGPASYQIDLADGGNNVVSNNTIQKGVNSPQGHVIDFGGEGTYAGSTLLLSGNTVINESTLLGSAAVGLLNLTHDPVSGTIDPAQIIDNTFYDVPVPYQDVYGPPYDVGSGNSFLPLSLAPVLDTSAPFDVPAPVGLGPVLLAAACVARWRRRRGGRWCARANRGCRGNQPRNREQFGTQGGQRHESLTLREADI